MSSSDAPGGRMRSPGKLEAAVMDCLWSAEHGLRVREVQAALSARNLAYTTVMTVLDNLYKKGWLERERVGRGYVYQPMATREANTARLMAEALGTGGDHSIALMHFVDAMSTEDAASLSDALRRLRRRDRKR